MLESTDLWKEKKSFCNKSDIHNLAKSMGFINESFNLSLLAHRKTNNPQTFLFPLKEKIILILEHSMWNIRSHILKICQSGAFIDKRCDE